MFIEKNTMARWKCEEKVDALYAGGRQLASSIHEHRTRRVGRAQDAAHEVMRQDNLVQYILKKTGASHFRNPNGYAQINKLFNNETNILRPDDPPNFKECMSSVDTTMRKFIKTMNEPSHPWQSMRTLYIQGILEQVTVVGVDKSTCFPTLCTWLITHKDELVDVDTIDVTDIDLRDSSENMNHFATLVRSGALANLTELHLGRNNIGDEGMQVFSTAISSGALASLTHLMLNSNQIGDVGITAFAGAIRSGSLASLQKLYLNHNQIGDAGMIAFAEALKPTDESPMGALATLTRFDLRYNQIGDEGMKVFSTALSSGSLASLETLLVDNGPVGDGHPALKEACVARGITLFVIPG